MYDAWELLARELDMPTDVFLKRMATDYPALRRELGKTKIFTKNIPLVLGQDLLQKGGDTPLLTKGRDIKTSLDSLANRMVQDPDALLKPMIQATEEMNAYLKAEILLKLEAIRAKIQQNKGGEFTRIYSVVEKRQDIKELTNFLGDIVERHLTAPEIISHILSPEASEEKDKILEESINAAFASMVTLRFHTNFPPGITDSRQHLIDMGTVALFQDISRLEQKGLREDDDFKHAQRSAEIGESMGLSEEVLLGILHHHRTVDDRGAPILLSGRMKTTLFERIIVSVNHFMECIARDKLNLNNQQTFFVMNYLAARGYLDAKAVRVLGSLYIGKKKNFIVSHGLELMKHCDHFEATRPYLWDMTSDCPTKFLCQYSNCRHLSGNLTILKKDLKYDHPSMPIDIPAGEYWRCNKLSRLLTRLIEIINQKFD